MFEIIFKKKSFLDVNFWFQALRYGQYHIYPPPEILKIYGTTSFKRWGTVLLKKKETDEVSPMPYLIALRECLGHRAVGINTAEPNRFPELRRQSWKHKETKTIRVLRTEYWRGENYRKRETQSSAKGLHRVYSRTLIDHEWRKWPEMKERTIHKD